MREELAVVAPRTLDGVQESEELQDEKEEKEEGSAIDETDETTNERTTEDGESGAAAGSSSSPTLKVGVRVVHETLGQCVITAMGDGTLHGNKKLELEFEANGAKRRKWVDKSDVCVQVWEEESDEDAIELDECFVEHTGPALASHERARQMRHNPPPQGARSGKRMGERKTPEPKDVQVPSIPSIKLQM